MKYDKRTLIEIQKPKTIIQTLIKAKGLRNLQHLYIIKSTDFDKRLYYSFYCNMNRGGEKHTTLKGAYKSYKKHENALLIRF